MIPGVWMCFLISPVVRPRYALATKNPAWAIPHKVPARIKEKNDKLNLEKATKESIYQPWFLPELILDWQTENFVDRLCTRRILNASFPFLKDWRKKFVCWEEKNKPQWELQYYRRKFPYNERTHIPEVHVMGSDLANISLGAMTNRWTRDRWWKNEKLATILLYTYHVHTVEKTSKNRKSNSNNFFSSRRQTCRLNNNNSALWISDWE